MDIKDIKKLAALSRVNIEDQEQEGLLKEMDSILAYVDQVRTAAAISPAAANNEKPASRNVWREDNSPHESGIFTETLLASSPDRQGQYIKVKKVL